MGYSNKYSNKPFERASKISHTDIINDEKVLNFLSRCRIPPYYKEIPDEDFKFQPLKNISENPIKNIIAIDGGYTDIYVNKDFPSSTIAFFQFGALFFKYEDLINLKNKPFIDPKDMAKLQDINKIKLIIPTKGITLNEEIDFVSSVRKTIYEFFISQPEEDKKEDKFIEILKWLIFENYKSSDFNNSWHLATCPHCNEGVDIQEKNLLNNYTFVCPHCSGSIYFTDILRLHEVIDNELGATGILGYITTTIEQIIIVYLIKCILKMKPFLLGNTLFIKDGPLVFFGQTANLHKPMRKLINYLNKEHNIYLVGLEKSGSFVEHAEQIRKKIPPKHFLLLGNKYIYKYIIPSVKKNDPYGSSSYYSHKLIFKSEDNNMYVVSIPNIEAKIEPQITDYINIEEILYNITALKCDLYDNSIIPIAMVNNLVSIANTSSIYFKEFIKKNMKE